MRYYQTVNESIINSKHTLDGRNPPPVHMVNIWFFTGFVYFYIRSQAVQVPSDFWLSRLLLLHHLSGSSHKPGRWWQWPCGTPNSLWSQVRTIKMLRIGYVVARFVNIEMWLFIVNGMTHFLLFFADCWQHTRMKIIRCIFRYCRI